MELRVYSRYNDHKDMSLTILRERAKLNIQSDQGYSDQVIKSEFPLQQVASVKYNEIVGLLTNLEKGCKKCYQ